MRCGRGEATTRRQPRPASSTTSQPSARRSIASNSRINVPMGLLGFWKAGSSAATSTWVTSVTAWSGMPRRLNSLKRHCWSM